MTDIASDQYLDCKGLRCPLPIIRTAAALKTLSAGQVLHMDATDPASVPDMAAWSRRTRHEIIAQKEGQGVYSFWVRKSG
jgi:TusA-related sulfurtransferase